jgi:sulfur dioxygenase
MKFLIKNKEKMKIITAGVILFVMAVFLFSQDSKIPAISNKEFSEKLKNDKIEVLLDVRTEEELRGPLGQIDGVINIPVQQLNRRLNELEEYKDNEITVICRTDNRSSKAVEILRNNGFNAVHVKGGMLEYRKNEGK